MKKKTVIFYIVMLATLQAISSMAQAEVYRWVDEDGVAHFTDKPKSHPDAEKIEIKTDALNKDSNQSQRLKKQRRLLNVIDEERRIKQQEQEKEKQEKLARQKKCKNAKNTLDSYLRSGQLFDVDKNGNKFYLSDQEREQEIQRMKKIVEYWCK